ncbi:helix-turn-helix transcriptional regulator [Arthrobacter sp. B1I2]|uniref:helix-turn-helix transcriptional regulator n=1 Tax=Arthrobacter sp. B1I2 TaxID=3042263 RepID=UPI00278B4D79|nr:helix-turn-helix domain-containing protein [Arthrobacter sp. B1I2]MDQ0731792.1 excisionase family DNA binding protein [Arthrobacter sp. B1I2]
MKSLNTDAYGNDPLMTTAQLADYLAIPVQSLYMLRHRKQGPPAIKIGAATIRFRKSQVDAWLAQHVELT